MEKMDLEVGKEAYESVEEKLREKARQKKRFGVALENLFWEVNNVFWKNSKTRRS